MKIKRTKFQTSLLEYWDSIGIASPDIGDGEWAFNADYRASGKFGMAGIYLGSIFYGRSLPVYEINHLAKYGFGPNGRRI